MKKLLFLALFATSFITFDLKAENAETTQTEEAKAATPQPKKQKKYANIKCKNGKCLKLKGKGKATPFVRSRAKTVN